MTAPLSYRAFLEAKRPPVARHGVPCGTGEIATHLKDGRPLNPHQRAIIRWCVEGGRRAIFAKFGLGKSIMQLETMRLLTDRSDSAGLIVAPLGVRRDMRLDAEALGIGLKFVKRSDEVDEPGLYLTNYETIRDGKIDPTIFEAVSLDEASVLRGFGGTKTFREFMGAFAETRYRFVATATPSPNDYIELLAYAAFLGIMDVGEAKTRFFKRDATKADTLHAHKEEEFWLWVSSWGVMLQRPSDLGFPDDGYDLPPLDVRWHVVQADLADAQAQNNGQYRLMRDAALGLVEASRARRDTLGTRVSKAAELVAEAPDEHVILWHDLEDERRAIEVAVPGVLSVYGTQELDAREAIVGDFADGRLARLAAKPVMLGSGCNLQRHCHRAVFVGVGFKFNDFIQAIHRLWRFQQAFPVRIDIISAETETQVVANLKAKWARHDAMMERMSAIIREWGLNPLDDVARVERSIGCVAQEAVGGTLAGQDGPCWRAVHADCVEEAARTDSDSVDLIVTSIPFGTQYEYSPSYNDFGHTDDDDHFFRQMGYLSPELLRVLKPGRVAAVHVKDRIRPGGMDGLGFQTVSPFHAETIAHYRAHGFAYLGMITVVTDVVRENNQTYRLGWSEQCKDGTRMGVGMPEYVLLFRKPPTDRSNGYADVPVVKDKASYTRARWQVDAHGYWRSSGDRLLVPSELVGMAAGDIFKRFRGWSEANVQDHELHVAAGQALEDARQLPPGFMLLQPTSPHPDVWTDVTRMRTLNGAQHAKGREMHLCPLQFDIVDRLIGRYSAPGELVLDPFGGLMTVPLRALMLGRRGLGFELNENYWRDGVRYLEEAERERSVPTLFELLDAEHALEPMEVAA